MCSGATTTVTMTRLHADAGCAAAGAGLDSATTISTSKQHSKNEQEQEQQARSSSSSSSTLCFLLHKSCYSSVFLGAPSAAGPLSVYKVYERRCLQPRHYLNLSRECAVLARLRDARVPGVVKLLSVADTPRHLSLQFAPVLGGTLFARLNSSDDSACAGASGGSLAGDERALAREVVAPLLRVLATLHAMGIVHRDVKPENILFEAAPPAAAAAAAAKDGGGGGALVLADFGLAVDTSPGAGGHVCRSRVGTLDYMAPEVHAQPSADTMALRGIPAERLTPYGPAVDVWAVGVLLHEALSGSTPFAHPEPAVLRLRAQYAPAPRLPAGCASREAQAFVDAALQKAPERRPSAAELLRHPWILTHLGGGDDSGGGGSYSQSSSSSYRQSSSSNGTRAAASMSSLSLSLSSSSSEQGRDHCEEGDAAVAVTAAAAAAAAASNGTASDGCTVVDQAAARLPRIDVTAASVASSAAATPAATATGSKLLTPSPAAAAAPAPQALTLLLPTAGRCCAELPLYPAINCLGLAPALSAPPMMTVATVVGAPAPPPMALVLAGSSGPLPLAAVIPTAAAAAPAAVAPAAAACRCQAVEDGASRCLDAAAAATLAPCSPPSLATAAAPTAANGNAAPPPCAVGGRAALAVRHLLSPQRGGGPTLVARLRSLGGSGALRHHSRHSIDLTATSTAAAMAGRAAAAGDGGGGSCVARRGAAAAAPPCAEVVRAHSSATTAAALAAAMRSPPPSPRNELAPAPAPALTPASPRARQAVRVACRRMLAQVFSTHASGNNSNSNKK